MGWVCLTYSRRERNKTCRGLYSPAMEGPEQARSSVYKPALPPTPYQPGRAEEQGIAGWTREETPPGDVEMEGRHLSAKGLTWTKAGGGKVQGTFRGRNGIISAYWLAPLKPCPMQLPAHNRFLISIAIESHGMYQG